MKLKRNKKTAQPSRRRTNVVIDTRANKFNYRSQRSVSEKIQGRSNRDTQTELQIKSGRTKWWQHIPTFIAIVVVAGSIIYTITLSTTPRITIVDQSNQSIMQPTSIYKTAAEKLLKGSLLNHSKLTINTDSIATKYEQQFPELNAVSIVIPLLGHTPVLEIRPSQSIIILSNPQGKFVINQQGNAVLQLDNTLINKYQLPVATDNSGFKVSLGHQVLPSASIAFIKTVEDQFTAKSQTIQSMTLSTTPYELDVQVRGLPYFIKFNLLSNPLYSTGTYFSAIKLFNASNPAPSQYIDIRIPGRAYYK